MATAWPALPLDDWEPTYRTLHMWTQVVGKVRMACAPFVNHWWHVPLYVVPRGLTTSAVPHGERSFKIDFDFLRHRLIVEASDGHTRELALAPMSVADFYDRAVTTLKEMDLPVEIWPMPVEVANPVRFPDDTRHAAYDREMVARLHQALVHIDRVMQAFRGRFLGKCSPVHFFWGAFDLAVTRFSGRENPKPPDDPVMGPGYSHEVISHGWWPGGDWPLGGRVPAPMFYAYAVPEPAGFRAAEGLPGGAGYDTTLGEYLLPYDAVRKADDPDEMLLRFMQRTYEVGADAAGWPRDKLELH